MKKLIIITGLTGTGKTDLAVKIAKDYNGEIISADSVQIYRHLNIGSAKVTAEEAQGIKHHLIDIKEFNENYNVGEFVRDCTHAIDEIISKGKLPIICGGTGLYVKALMDGYTLGDSADLEFRHKYEQLAKEKGNKYVWDILNDVSKEYASKVHPNNLKRVIRYLELTTHGKQAEKKDSPLKDFDVLCVGVIADREHIYEKLNKRVDIMMNAGLENEIKGLISMGAKREMQAFNSICYREWFDYFEGKQTKQQTIDLMKQHNRNYAKRQLTFLKTINDAKLMDINEAEVEIRRFLNDTTK